MRTYRHELLRVLEVVEQLLLSPGHSGVLVRVGVRERRQSAGSSADNAEEVWALLVSTTLQQTTITITIQFISE